MITIIVAVNGHLKGGHSGHTFLNIAYPDEEMMEDMKEREWQPLKEVLREHCDYLHYDPVSITAPLNNPPCIVYLGKGYNPHARTLTFEHP